MLIARIHFALCLMAAFGLLVAPARAQNYECNLSGIATGSLYGCSSGGAGGGTHTVTSAVLGNTDTTGTHGTELCDLTHSCGAHADSANSVAPIYAHGTCYWIDNNSNSSTFLVPSKSPLEWTQFLAHLPSGVTATPCAMPTYTATTTTGTGAVISPTITVTPPYTVCTSASVNTPNVYGRTGTTVAVWPTTPLNPTFTCNSTATTIQSALQWKGSGLSSYTSYWVQNFLFSPNLAMSGYDKTTSGSSASAISITAGDQIVLNFSYVSAYGTITSVAHSGPGWDGTTTPFTPTSATYPATLTYTATVTDSNGLASTATVTVTITGAASACGSDANTNMSSTPTHLCASVTDTMTGFNASTTGWTWNCTPPAASAQACGAYLAAQCNASATVETNGTIMGSACNVGTTPGTATITGSNYSYTCTGTGTANTALCAGTATSSQCGDANGQTMSTIPSVAGPWTADPNLLCAPSATPTGTPTYTAITATSGTWSWQCQGISSLSSCSSTFAPTAQPSCMVGSTPTVINTSGTLGGWLRQYIMLQNDIHGNPINVTVTGGDRYSCIWVTGSGNTLTANTQGFSRDFVALTGASHIVTGNGSFYGFNQGAVSVSGSGHTVTGNGGSSGFQQMSLISIYGAGNTISGSGTSGFDDAIITANGDHTTVNGTGSGSISTGITNTQMTIVGNSATINGQAPGGVGTDGDGIDGNSSSPISITGNNATITGAGSFYGLNRVTLVVSGNNTTISGTGTQQDGIVGSNLTISDNGTTTITAAGSAAGMGINNTPVTITGTGTTNFNASTSYITGTPAGFAVWDCPITITDNVVNFTASSAAGGGGAALIMNHASSGDGAVTINSNAATVTIFADNGTGIQGAKALTINGNNAVLNVTTPNTGVGLESANNVTINGDNASFTVNSTFEGMQNSNVTINGNHGSFTIHDVGGAYGIIYGGVTMTGGNYNALNVTENGANSDTMAQTTLTLNGANDTITASGVFGIWQSAISITGNAPIITSASTHLTGSYNALYGSTVVDYGSGGAVIANGVNTPLINGVTQNY